MRHKHTLSHYRLLTGDMGQLLPIGLVEALPGDTFQHSSSVFMRLSPLAAPVMHPVSLRVHHFFCPHRRTWPTEGAVGSRTGWEAFITGGPDNDDAQLIPTINTTGVKNDLMDYMGLPTVADVPVSALPIRAFNQVYNEFYRDADLAEERSEDDTSVPLIAWEKDYYTAARPWSQKGPAVTLPLGDRAPVASDAAFDSSNNANNILQVADSDGVYRPFSQGTTYVVGSGTTVGEGELYADLSNAEGVEINEFRKAFALQRYAEARARYGSRYTEYLRYLGVTPADSRLDRPEYLGGGRARVSMSEVLQTAEDLSTGPDRFGVGDMYGHGVASTRSNRYRRTFTEHGYVLSLLSVRPKSMYMDGIARTWLRRTNEDFWQRELQQIGQQEIWQGELYTTTPADPTEQYSTFGFQDRYSEYKGEKSRVSGEFRDTLKYWHLGREFQTKPVLNQSFTDCSPSKRIYNVQTEHGLWIAVQHNLVARRMVRRQGNSRIL